jgi:hypothetical protein
MYTFLLVILMLNGQPRAGVEFIPPPDKCEAVKEEVIALIEAQGAKVIKAECVTISES